MHTWKVQENPFLSTLDNKGYVRIKIHKVANQDNLQKWKDTMLEKAKCWNKFCLGLCDEHELRPVYVAKEGNEEMSFLTTLCEDCIKTTADFHVLINENHLIVETHRKE